MVPWGKGMNYNEQQRYSDVDMGILKEAYIFKQSHSMLKHWRTRYLVLTVDCLHIYKRKGDFGSLPSEVITFDGLSMALEESNDKRRKFCLKISSMTSPVSRRGNILCFFSDEERTDWWCKILETVTARWLMDKESREIPLRLTSRLIGLQSRSMETLGGVIQRSPANFRSRERPRSMEITTLHSTGLFGPKQCVSRSKGLFSAKTKFRPLSASTEFLAGSRDSILLTY